MSPGKYTANITIDKQLVSYPFEIIADPNFKVSNADLKEQEQFLLQVAGSFKEIMNTLKGAKEIKSFFPEYVQVTNAGQNEAKPHLL